MTDSRFEAPCPVPERELLEVEAELGRRLPDDYRSFAATFGGAFVGGSVDGAGELSVLAFFGAGTLGDILRLHSDLKEEGILPIADCALGNLYVLDTDNSVHFLDYYGRRSGTQKVAKSFQEFADRIVVADDE